MSYGYTCDRCGTKLPVTAYAAKVEGVEIRARFMDQGRYVGRRWLHACMKCWDEMFSKPKYVIAAARAAS